MFQAIDCYQDAERRLRNAGDEYQFERAVAAISQGLEHVAAAERMFNSRHASGVTDSLAKLAALHDSGDLTDAEFAEQKRRLLGA